MRLDQYVATYWPEYSRSQWQKYIAAGYVLVNGTPELSVKYPMAEDDEVTTNLPPQPDYEHRTLPIVYETPQVVVINKPAGILTHAKGAVSDEFTVADFMRPRTTDGVEGNRPGIVHRLDRDTSGILIAAKTLEAKRHLQKQFQDRKAKKTYIAIVRGIPKLSTARIDIALERNPKAPATFRASASGKSAETFYEVLAHNDTYSLVRLKPTTGRTHQLRVHMQHIGTPIVGDPLYDTGKSSGGGPIGRLCLHAESLEITVPGGERMTFHAPLPDDFEAFARSISG